MPETHTIDLEDEVEDIESELDEIREEAADTDPESERGQTLEARYKSLTARLNGFQDTLDSWGRGTIVVKELTFGELMMMRDDVQEQSFEVDPQTGNYDGIPKSGYYKVAVLRQAIVDSPEAAASDPADWPPEIGSWVYEEVDSMNTAKGVDAGNLWEEA